MSAADFFGELGISVPDIDCENLMIPCFANPTAHAHDDRNKSLSLHLPTGRWRCHGCGEAGNAYSAALMFGLPSREAADLAKRFGLFKEIPKPRMPSPTQIKKWRAALMENRKLLNRLWQVKGWTPPAVARCGLGWDGSRITFPICQYKPHTETVHLKCVGMVRYLPGGKPKSKADPGSRRLLFPAPIGKGSEELPLFVVEGEPDAVSVRSCDHRAVAVPGAHSWRTEFANDLRRFRNLVVVTDCDDEGRKLARQIKFDLPHAKVLDLDPSRSDGWDIGEMVAEAARDGGLRQVNRFLTYVARANAA